MSGIALLEILIYLVTVGFQIPPQQGDENLAAHVFQFLLAFQIPIIAYFVLKNIRVSKIELIKILILQFLSALLPFSIVFFMEM